MAEIVMNLLEELTISIKLIIITSDNTGNNDTLADKVLHNLREAYHSTLGSIGLV
jgi:hypothetical protein